MPSYPLLLFLPPFLSPSLLPPHLLYPLALPRPPRRRVVKRQHRPRHPHVHAGLRPLHVHRHAPLLPCPLAASQSLPPSRSRQQRHSAQQLRPAVGFGNGGSEAQEGAVAQPRSGAHKLTGDTAVAGAAAVGAAAAAVAGSQAQPVDELVVARLEVEELEGRVGVYGVGLGEGGEADVHEGKQEGTTESER